MTTATSHTWTRAALDYFASRAIDPAAAQQAGVVARHPWLYFPNGRRRRLTADQPRFSQPSGQPLDLWTLQHSTAEPHAVLVCEGECLRGSAEVLTDGGFIRFDQLTGDERVAQYHADGSLSMVKPLAYIQKPYSGNLVRHRNTRRFTITTTPEHKHVARDWQDKLVWFRADQPVGHYRTPRAGVLDGEGVPLSDEQLRLAVAVSADAAIRPPKTGPRYAVFSMAKVRKLNRLTALLQSCEVDHEVVRESCGSKIQITCHLPEWVPGRLFPAEWLTQLSADQRRLFIEELVEWDGNRVPNRSMTEYSSKLEHNASWVQTLAHTIGMRSTVTKRRNAYGEWWKVSLLRTPAYASYQSMKIEDVPYDGDVYCVTVPTGMILVRDEGCITITGNSDALAALTSLPATPPETGLDSLAIVCVPGVGFPVTRLAEGLRFHSDAFLAFDADPAGWRYRANVEAALVDYQVRPIPVELPEATDLAGWLASMSPERRGNQLAYVLCEWEAAAKPLEHLQKVREIEWYRNRIARLEDELGGVA